MVLAQRSRVRSAILFALGTLATIGVSPASLRADVVLNIQSLSAAAGSTGNTFDVTLTNTGSSSIAIGGFSFGLKVADTDITLTKATIATSPSAYIFGSNSLFGPDITVLPTPSGSNLVASDLITTGAATVNAGTTVGLGHVFFNVKANALNGAFLVTFTAFPTTNFADANGNDITSGLNPKFGTGTITIFGGVNAVPEPSVMALAAVGLLSLGALRFGKGRRQRA